MSYILDGAGSNRRAKVNSRNKLLVRSTAEPIVAAVSAEQGLSYLLASDFISLTTTGSFNALMYVKNTSTNKNLHIGKIRTCSSGSGFMQVRLIAQPTSGTIVSDANSSDLSNANLSSGNVFDGISYSASGDGKTITDGSNFAQFINMSPGHSVQDYEGSIVLGPSDSIGLTCKPSVATIICIEIQCYFEEI